MERPRRRDLPKKSRLFFFVGCTPLVLENTGSQIYPSGCVTFRVIQQCIVPGTCMPPWSVLNQRRDLSSCFTTRFFAVVVIIWYYYLLRTFQLQVVSIINMHRSRCVAHLHRSFAVDVRSDCRTCCPREGLLCLYTAVDQHALINQPRDLFSLPSPIRFTFARKRT